MPKHPGSQSRKGRPPRQAPPPETTGAEQRFLSECRSAGRAVDVRMEDGSAYRGRIKAHTPQVLSLETEAGVIELRTALIRLVAEA